MAESTISWEPARRGKQERKERRMKGGASACLLLHAGVNGCEPLSAVKTISANFITVDAMGTQPNAHQCQAKRRQVRSG